MSGFNQLPIVYRQKWIDFTDKSSISPQEVAEDISVMLSSLTNVKKWNNFHKIVLALRPEQRIVEGLVYLCHLINMEIDDKMKFIKEGALLLSEPESRFISSVGDRLLGNEGWNVMLEHGLQQLSLKSPPSYNGEPTPYKATQAFLNMLQDIITKMNGFYLLAIKVGRSWKLPEVYKRTEWLENALNPEHDFGRQYCASKIHIKRILNPTVSKSLYLNFQCRDLHDKYFQLKYSMLNQVQPTPSPT